MMKKVVWMRPRVLGFCGEKPTAEGHVTIVLGYPGSGVQGKAGWRIAGQIGMTCRLQQLANVFRGAAENGGVASHDDRTLDQNRFRCHGDQQLAFR